MASISEVLSIALEHQRAGRLDLAEECCRQIVAAASDHIDALHLQGVVAHQAGRHAQAVECFGRAIQCCVTNAAACYNSQGEAYRALGRLADAADSFRRALELDPRLARSHNNLGLVLRASGKVNEAIACYQQALQLQPDLSAAHHNLADALLECSQVDAAIRSFERALQLAPDVPSTHSNLGNALQAAGRMPQAIACYQRALQLDPANAEAHYNLARAWHHQGNLELAFTCCRRAVALKPAFAEAHHKLGTLWYARGDLDKAVDCTRRALELKPDYAHAIGSLAFLLQYRDGTTLEDLARIQAQFEDRCARPLRATWRPHANSRDPDRTLRLGFLSGDFARHRVGYFYLRALEHLRSEDCRIVCYSGRQKGDDFTDRFFAAAHVWRDVAGFSDEMLVEQIRADGIDILVELAGHAAGNRLLALARKPAPIQFAWAGATGISAIDYLLADKHLAPPAADRFYRERVLRLPDVYACYEPPDGAPSVGPLPALTRGAVTLGSLNNPTKINVQVARCWAEILSGLPGSRLVLRYVDTSPDAGDQAIRRWRELLAERGVSADRIEFREAVPYARRLDVYNEIDLALDPFPFSGCTTTCEALWMGVPVITLPGETYASRQSLSILSAVGADEFVARDRADYVARAQSLARDIDALAGLRSVLRQGLATSPLCDGKRFAANLIQVLRTAWTDWCKQA